jgi:hypothetical protein
MLSPLRASAQLAYEPELNWLWHVAMRGRHCWCGFRELMETKVRERQAILIHPGHEFLASIGCINAGLLHDQEQHQRMKPPEDPAPPGAGQISYPGVDTMLTHTQWSPLRWGLSG